MAESLQDSFLTLLRDGNASVSIFLVNGIRLSGQIDSFDKYVVMLKNPAVQTVYKHAISTMGRLQALMCQNRLIDKLEFL